MPRFRSDRESILKAYEPAEVERILTEALGQVAPEEIGSLPVEARQVLIERRVDMHAAAVVLLQCDLRHRGDPQIGELTRQLAELFASASVRLSEIEHRRFPA